MAVEVDVIVGAECIEGGRHRRSFIGPLTPKGNEGESRGFGSRKGRIGCVNLKE